jgi:hypothetical protein
MSSLFDNIEHNIIKNKFKNIHSILFNESKHNIIFFLLGCIQLYFFSELVKSSSLIEKNKKHYNNCYSIISKYVIEKDSKKVCEILNDQENFQSFIYNLFYTLIFVYAIMRELINKRYIPVSYWIISSISIFIYSMSDNIDYFRFSLVPGTNYNPTQLRIILFFSLFISIIIIRQIWLNKVEILLISKIIFFYLLIYCIFLSVSNSIIIHFHHSIVCGILSLCFTDFNSKFDLYVHAILLGIIIQGFNFYGTSEIILFYISDLVPPNFNYMIILNFLFLIFLVCLNLIKKFYCKREKKIRRNNLEMQLIPIYEN